MNADLRIVMLGTGDFALPTFDLLCETGHDVVALFTQPDRPQGRKHAIIPSRIKSSALSRGVAVHQPENVNSAESIERLRGLRPEVLVTAAYGQILSAEVLSIPPLGGINLHGSVLPAYRGAAPVARAIERGETETGVTVIRMTPRIDAGGMIAVARLAIGPDETAGELEDRLARLGAPRVIEALAAIVAGTAEVLPQDRTKVTKAPKLGKEDGRIDWSRTAQEVHDLVRAMQPWPTAWTVWQPSEVERPPVRLIVHRTKPNDLEGEPGRVIEAGRERWVVAAGRGSVELLEVQTAGKKPCSAADFLRGHPAFVGDRFGG